MPASRLDAAALKGRLVDTHTHCGGVDLSNFYKKRYPYGQDILDLEGKREAAGVDYQVVFPMPTSIYYHIPSYWRRGAFVPSGYCDYPFQLENEHLFASISRFSLERMLPFAGFSLQAQVPRQERAVWDLAQRYPLYGLKYHTKVDQKNALAIERDSDFLDLARALGIPITVHTEEKGCSSAAALLELAARHPEVRFCAAHFGGFSQAVFDAMSRGGPKNLYLDTCPLLARCRFLARHGAGEGMLDLPYHAPRQVLDVDLEAFGTRLLWGTDAPWYNYGALEAPAEQPLISYADEAAAVEGPALRALFAANAQRYLFGNEVEER